MRCHVGLGGNLGDVRATFAEALRLINAAPEVRLLTASGVYRTAPMGEHAGEAFLNAAALVETALSPRELLDDFQGIEDRLGRTRTLHWGPRPIDLDILLCETMLVEEARLIVPHPGLGYRRFVLDPLAEIAPEARDPQTGLTVRELRQRLLVRPLTVAVVARNRRLHDVVAAALRQRFTDVEVVERPAQDRPALSLSLGDVEPQRVRTNPDVLSAPGRVSLPGRESNAIAAAVAVVQAALDQPVRVGDLATGSGTTTPAVSD
jgi:2-amino-4-hydroxy-6-hydroxymethyldihydropteridine diphosphokinase